MASIELVDDRYDDFATIGGPTQVADNAFDAGVVLGRPRLDWRGLDLAALTARTWCDGVLLAEGRSDALLGHPWTLWLGSPPALAWAGVGRRHLRQPGHDHAGAVGRRTSHFRVEVDGLGEVVVTVA